MADFDHNKTQEVDLVTGACFMTPAEVFKKVGGFDERYFYSWKTPIFAEKFGKPRKKLFIFRLRERFITTNAFPAEIFFLFSAKKFSGFI